jgi:assimilatory nitrate reductase catalytic subunit
MLDQRGGIQWPYPCGEASPIEDSPLRKLPKSRFGETRLHDASERRLFEEGRFYHPDGRAQFLCESPKALPEQPNPKYPFVLLTGRGSAAQWHTQTRTAKSAVLRKLYSQVLYVEINPHDSQRLAIRSGDRVTVSSQRGRLHGRAFVTPTVQPGQLFIPMHYDTTNLLTHSAFDPYSHQPAYKACAVSLETQLSSV